MRRRWPFSPEIPQNIATRRSSDPSLDAEPETRPLVGVELLGYGPGGVDLESAEFDVAAPSSRAGQRDALVPVAGLLCMAFLALYLLGSSATPSEQIAYLNGLDLVDSDLLEGLVIAWISNDDRLAIRELDTGDSLPVSTLAEHDLPPLPRHIQLIGAENATWLIDLVDPEYSGKLSNNVRMVRLGSDLDSYGFISRSEDGGPTDFFVGSLWGPSGNGTAQTPSSWTILPVPGSGIVVSSPTAESSSIGGSGLEPFPRHVGRVVAATTDHLAGVSCDNRLHCVGVVSQWDGTEQQVFDANALSNAATVRISPDGGRVVSVIGSTWTIFDLEADHSQQFDLPPPADSSVTWTPDSSALVWIVEGTVLAIDVDRGFESGFESDFQPALVSPVGVIGERLPDSEVIVYDVDTVVSSAAETG